MELSARYSQSVACAPLRMLVESSRSVWHQRKKNFPWERRPTRDPLGPFEECPLWVRHCGIAKNECKQDFTTFQGSQQHLGVWGAVDVLWWIGVGETFLPCIMHLHCLVVKYAQATIFCNYSLAALLVVQTLSGRSCRTSCKVIKMDRAGVAQPWLDFPVTNNCWRFGCGCFISLSLSLSLEGTF